jgi:two-component system, cell cycle response regulator
VTVTREDATRVRSPAEGASPRGGDACLVFVEGDAVLGLRVPIAGEVVLGRDAACTVALPAEDVSRRHARIAPDGPGHVVVDLGSTNGTWVDGREIAAHRLRGGERIRVGPFVATYLAAGEPTGRELEDLARLARRDPLTGLANRRAFEEDLAREAARAARSRAPLSAIIVDVDHFKRVNDTHGHPAGDAVLAAVAARVGAALRRGDLLARLGGEEFGILLPATELAAAAELAERVRARVAAEPVPVAGAAIAVTVSAGCAALGAGEADGRGLLARADARLYDAKRGGRDRVAS